MESGERASVLARAAFSLVIAARSATAVAQKAWMYKLAGAVLLDALERPADAAACFAAMAGQTPREAYGWALARDAYQRVPAGAGVQEPRLGKINQRRCA